MHSKNTLNPQQIVIALTAVSYQISAVAFQKLFCIAAAPDQRIAIQDDLQKSIRTTSEPLESETL